MALRMISYGYKMENGVIVVSPEEAEIVNEIFKRYGEGEILKAIADDLTARQVVFYMEKTEWNKNTIARIIENRRYIGADDYPVIVSEDDFERANSRKARKIQAKNDCSEETDYLKNTVFCGQCGRKMYRHASWSVREKWLCSGGCKNDIYIGDRELTCGILDALVKAKNDPACIEVQADKETYHPSLDIVRRNNEIKRLTEQANVQFGAVKKLIFEIAEMKFSCCEDDFSAHTEYIKQNFSEWNNTEELDMELMKKTVERISVEKDGSIAVTLINKAKVKGRW